MRYQETVPKKDGLRLHAALLLAETVLVANVLKEETVALVVRSSLDPWLRVVFSMAVVVGFLGGFFLLVQGLTRDTVGAVQGALRRRGVDRVLVHALLLGGLYLLYAHRLGLAPWR